MLSKSFHVNQSVGAVPRWEAKACTHFCSKHKLNLTVHSDTLIQRKSTLNLNMEYEGRRCTFISMNYKCISVHISRQSLYNPFSIAVKNQTRKKRTAEK